MNKDSQIVTAVLAGSLIKNKDGSWRSGSYEDDGDDFGLDGHRLRVEAARWLFKDNTSRQIIASGGKGQYEKIPGAPATCAVIKKELIALGVPADRIIEESTSGSTYQQLLEISRMFVSHNWGRLEIVSNGWHLPRIKAMISNLAELAELKQLYDNGQVVLIDADRVLLEKSPAKWKDLIEKTRQSKAYRDRLALEAKGTQEIENGTYKFK